MPAAHRRLTCITLLLVTIAAGLIWRLAPLHLPWFAYKYGGSALWAIALYWLIAAVLPRHKSLQIALIAATLATALEFSRLYHLPTLDAFPPSLPPPPPPPPPPETRPPAASSPQRTSPPTGWPSSPQPSSTISLTPPPNSFNFPLPQRMLELPASP